MRKILLLILILTSIAAAPTRQNTYTSGTVISSTAVTANEDAIFQYLQNGVDTIKDGVIVNADVNSAAAIADTKLAQITTASKVHTSSVTGTLGVANGGSGAATLTDGGVLLGSGTDAITAMSVLADGEVIVGDGTTDPVALGAFTSSSGTLKHERGGIEADISAVAKGGIVSGTGSGTMGLLAVGSNNQVLIADSGESNGVKWGDAGVAKISSTTVTAADPTSNITIGDSKRYLIIFHLQADNNADGLYMRFNDDGGNNYDYARKTLTFAASPTEAVSGGAGATELQIIATGEAAQLEPIHGQIWIDTNTISGGTNDISASVRGEVIYGNSTTLFKSAEFFGTWTVTTVPTHFDFFTPGASTLTGDIDLYEFGSS